MYRLNLDFTSQWLKNQKVSVNAVASSEYIVEMKRRQSIHSRICCYLPLFLIFPSKAVEVDKSLRVNDGSGLPGGRFYA